MANIWKKDDSHREKPNRNIIDLSFQNNLTLDFGYLYPVVVQPTIPGDSYEFKPTFALNFESMVFPIQTRMRSYLHFFKVRNRNLWKDWEDFIGKNKQGLEVPYIDESITMARTGKLLDYLGVPTTIVGRYANTYELGEYTNLSDIVYLSNVTYTPISDTNTDVTNIFSPLDDLDKVSLARSSDSTGKYRIIPINFSNFNVADNVTNVELSLSFKEGNWSPLNYFTPLSGEPGATWVAPTPRTLAYFAYFVRIIECDNENNVISIHNVSNSNGLMKFDVPVTFISTHKFYIATVSWYSKETGSSQVYLGSHNVDNQVWSISALGVTDNVSEIDSNTSPYWRSNDNRGKDTIKLRALRPRAYEYIYNAIYRFAQNNPYKINGVEEYNKYIPTLEGGLDSNKYELRRRNWEDDFLTTALPMPQAGIAPLVGLTGTAGAATVTIANSNGETVVANAQVDEDGNITSLTTDASSNLASSLLDTVTYGISINDLRNVNAFQRWLEAKARGGYKYKDQIETLFGVTVRYDTLDMPEFIGGMSLDVYVNQITQTVNVSPSSPLGDIAGQASCIGTGETIHEYCDEHGYIIGILSVVPVPNYSQLLDKDWFKSDAFDYYFPQFGHIGMQPITYKEVCPVQAFQESTDTVNVLEDTFGYQRAWYDYLARTDEVHGHFRTTLRDFVMNRTFDVKPELSESFLLVDNEQLNDVFAITDNSVPKIRGQIYFDIKAKRPIPLYGIPKLE